MVLLMAAVFLGCLLKVEMPESCCIIYCCLAHGGPGPFGVMVLCVLPGVNLTIISWTASDDAHIARIWSCLLPLTKEGLDCHPLCYLEGSKSAQILEGVGTASAIAAFKSREPYSCNCPSQYDLFPLLIEHLALLELDPL